MLISLSSFLSFSIVLTECITVVLSLLEKHLPISGRDFEVSCFERYIAVCLGLTKYLDRRGDNISFLLILKNLQTMVCIKSIVTLFSDRFIKSFNIILTSLIVEFLSIFLKKIQFYSKLQPVPCSCINLVANKFQNFFTYFRKRSI